MSYDALYSLFLKTSFITCADFEIFKSLSTEKLYKKNSIIINQGDAISHVYLIKAGNLMTYLETQNKQIHVIQFGKDGWWTGDIESWESEVEANFTIKAMTDTSIIVLEKADFERLLIEAPSFEKYFRLIFQKLMISFQKRVIQNITLSSEKRYEKLLEEFPKCELVFPQKYIAAYLGITPEFLSKMKARIK
jgi:CRP-like cAMP-binding protein